MPKPRDRAISHHNLANYLERHDAPADLAEAPRHQLAALIYWLAAGRGQNIQNSLHSYANGFRRAHEAGIELDVPRVTELLADPAFHPLDQWLRLRQVDIAELQVKVDRFLNRLGKRR